MEIKKIIVDELPSVCDKCELAENFDIFDRKGCVATKRFLRNPSKERPDWCPLVVEECCEWVGRTKCKGRVDEYYQYKSPHDPPHYHYHNIIGKIDDRKTYIYCHVCGKRIRYVEEE